MIAERIEIQAKINPQERKEISAIPEQAIVVVYRDGTGRDITERVGISFFDDSNIVKEIRGEQERLKGRLNQIPRQLEKLSKKIKKSGRPYSQAEQTQIRERLEREKKGIPDRVSAMSDSLNKLREKFVESNPLGPLRVTISRKLAIKRIEGQPFPEEEQEWWKFVRNKAPEIWDSSGPEGERYQIAHDLFVARWRLKQARTRSIQEEKEAERRLFEVTGDISDEMAKRMEQIFIKILIHFTSYE